MPATVTITTMYCDECRAWTHLAPPYGIVAQCGECGEEYRCGECGSAVDRDADCLHPELHR